MISKFLFFYLFISCVVSFSAEGQKDSITNYTTPPPEAINPKNIYIGQVTEEASFPGGKKALSTYLRKNIERCYDSSGVFHDRIFVTFLVQKDGSLAQVRISRGGEKCPSIKKSILEAFNKMPKWIPAKHNDKPVLRLVTLPINL